MRFIRMRVVSLVVVLQFCAAHLRIQEAQDPQELHSESVESGACPWAVPKYVAFCKDTSSASNLTTERVDRSIDKFESLTLRGNCRKSNFARRSSAATRPLRGSRFAKVLRIITHAYAHQIDFFLAQSQTDFWGTVFVNPKYENAS